MDVLAPALHRTIVCVDVERFGDLRRTAPHQVAVRRGLYRCLRTAFSRSGVSWQDCYQEDRGDGALVLVPAEVPKSLLAAKLPGELAVALAAHNQVCDRLARIRLRLAVHAGEIHHDEHGVAGTAINMAFRLLAAAPIKQALTDSAGVLAVIASSWFFEEVIRHDAASRPDTYRRVRISIKETEASAWIGRPDDPYPPRQGGVLPSVPEEAAVPRQLPAGVAGFAGRQAELRALTALLAELEEATTAGSTVVISAIGGTAGIGKTALAVHWAHQVADRFPDGQLYVNLRGFEPAGIPMTAAEALRGFLEAFEVPLERIPVSLDAQAALYRSLLVDRRVLVLLDNARDIDQIRPLLPGSPGCVVVVTSRNRLTGLIAEGAHPLTLDTLPAADARQLLARRLGPNRIAAQPRAVEEIITRCARLPLALSIVAARAAIHPTFPLSALADELRDTHQRLGTLGNSEDSSDARAAFSWSYRQLSPDAARLFRLLGLHPGPDTNAPAAASLAGIPVKRAQDLLTELTRGHLIAEPLPGRFTFHDLLRIYAIEQAHTHDHESERHAAVLRVLDHYLHTAYTAALLMYPGVPVITVAPPQSGVTPEEPADYAAAWAWFEAEYPVLLASIQQAATVGHSTHAWQLSWTLRTTYFRRQEHWRDWIATHHAALFVTEHHADQYGQATTLLGLGFVCARLGRYDEAHAHLQQALTLFEELGDQSGQADAHHKLGSLAMFQDRYKEAISHTRQALALANVAGQRRVQAGALNNLGWCYALLGNPHRTLTYSEQAFTIQQELGDRQGEANALRSIGYAHHLLGRHQQAIAHFKQALSQQQELGDLYHQATTLDHLGETHHAAGSLAAARIAWRQALSILNQLSRVPPGGGGYADPNTIRAKLRSTHP